MNKKQKKVLKRIIISTVLIVVLKLLPIDGYLESRKMFTYKRS